MYLLDTDHLSLLERGGAEAEHLVARLAAVGLTAIATTIVSYEEQTRGWLSYMARARSLDRQVAVYRRLQQHLVNFCTIPLVAFDEDAAQIVQRLQQARLRMGTMDMKIAAIALAHEATLLTRNLSDFSRVPQLREEDWTV
ncbi:MAG: type II toxin-antitoxin system VapC family toxin [Roseiflexaceae bacterium]